MFNNPIFNKISKMVPWQLYDYKSKKTVYMAYKADKLVAIINNHTVIKIVL